MIIPPQVTQCVVFIGCQKVDGTFVYLGTAFYYGIQPQADEAYPLYLVTARHVLDKVRSELLLDQVFIRVNLKDGTSTHYPANISDWYIHPTDDSVDVAIIRTGIPDEFDHIAVADQVCATDEILTKHEVALGDEVFITGLFRHHHGVKKNIPIARVGNLASMLIPQIMTEHCGEIEAYLIEARSIGGLSGSPVFLNLGITRSIQGQVKNATSGKPIFYLLGLVHGHFDVRTTEIDDAINDDGLSVDKVNTGIAIVVPFQKIKEVVVLYENQISN
ncbi:MAG: hypothetical protein SFX19_02760 [Alphaproteobacteria bacterium]|nr:hypothetical protein [Alphaproteobacteria bacterium]